MYVKKKSLIILVILISSSYLFLNKINKKTKSNIECLDTYQKCDSIYHLDSTYLNLHANLLYARWQIRNGNITESIKILDSLEILQSKIKRNSFYQEIVFYQFLARKTNFTLNVDEINDQLKLNLSEVHNINMLYFKSEILNFSQETNFAYTTALYAEYLRSNLSIKEEKEIYYLPWSIHAISLIREFSDQEVSAIYLNKALKSCNKITPGCRWLKTLLLTLNENIGLEKIKEIKEEVFKTGQYTPYTDKKILTHLSYVCSDNDVVINDLLSQIQKSESLTDRSNFYNVLYLIDAYLTDGDLNKANIWLDKISKVEHNEIDLYNLWLFRKQNLLFKQYIKSNSKLLLKELFNVSQELTNSYIKQGESIINDHYAETIYYANNIFLESLFCLLSLKDLSTSETLFYLNNTKDLYNKVSDSRSVLGAKKPTGQLLKRINYLKHEIEKRELSINRYQAIEYPDMSIFEELYFLHQELYEIKQGLEDVDVLMVNQEKKLSLSSINKQTQILDFIQTDSSLFLSKITSDKIDLIKLDYDLALKSIDEKKEQILDRSQSIEYNYLDSILVDLISDKHQKIIFIPDGELFDFPIESIQDEKGKYLVEDYNISYASQISEAINTTSSTIENEIFTASYTSDETFKDRKIKNYPELPFGQYEIEKIKELYTVNTSYSGNEFTEGVLTKGLDKDIVHISSHSSSSTNNPLDNYILVRNKEGDGVPIYGFTLKSMDWNTKLVVLSSCESGTGTIKPGCGIFSLSRDFIQSGAETVIKSLWKVNDKSTSELMIAFHENLRNGMTGAQALRRAKLKLQTNEEYSHPYYWAGFVLEGNPNILLGKK